VRTWRPHPEEARSGLWKDEASEVSMALTDTLLPGVDRPASRSCPEVDQEEEAIEDCRIVAVEQREEAFLGRIFRESTP
jgi:hypothetical protein